MNWPRPLQRTPLLTSPCPTHPPTLPVPPGRRETLTMALACRLSRCMALSLAILLSACLPVTAGEPAPPCSPVNVQLSSAQFDNLARHCAPAVSPEIMRALAKTESAMYHYVLSINYPETSCLLYTSDAADEEDSVD